MVFFKWDFSNIKRVFFDNTSHYFKILTSTSMVFGKINFNTKPLTLLRDLKFI